MMRVINQLTPLPPPSRAGLVPVLGAAAGEHARIRFLEFFAAKHPQPEHPPRL